MPRWPSVPLQERLAAPPLWQVTLTLSAVAIYWLLPELQTWDMGLRIKSYLSHSSWIWWCLNLKLIGTFNLKLKIHIFPLTRSVIYQSGGVSCLFLNYHLWKRLPSLQYNETRWHLACGAQCSKNTFKKLNSKASFQKNHDAVTQDDLQSSPSAVSFRNYFPSNWTIPALSCTIAAAQTWSRLDALICLHVFARSGPQAGLSMAECQPSKPNKLNWPISGLDPASMSGRTVTRKENSS